MNPSQNVSNFLPALLLGALLQCLPTALLADAKSDGEAGIAAYRQGSLMGIQIALAMFSYIYEDMDNRDEALRARMLAYRVSRAMNDPVEYGVAEAAIGNKQFDRARRHLERAEAVDPDSQELMVLGERLASAELAAQRLREDQEKLGSLEAKVLQVTDTFVTSIVSSWPLKCRECHQGLLGSQQYWELALLVGLTLRINVFLIYC